MTPRWLALIALVPAFTGPLPASASDGGFIVVALCSGGSIEIPLGDDDSGEKAPCHPQGCHGTTCRKRFDAAQGRAAQPLE